MQRGEATLSETLAAALLKIAGYTPEHILCDPFCGTGTLLIEAAFIATRTPPGFLRKSWGFVHMPEYNAKKWEDFKQVYNQKRIPLPKNAIFGADKDLTELNLSRAHLAKLGFSECIELAHKEVFSYHPPCPPTLIVTDPPFGKRLLSFQKTYEDFGIFLRRHCQTSKIFILSPNDEMIQAVGFPIASAFPLHHGGMEMYLYELNTELIHGRKDRAGDP